jgi:hypothetical protein
MDINLVASVLSDLFAVEAVFGLVLFAVVVAAIARGLLGERHRTDIRPHGRNHR